MFFLARVFRKSCVIFSGCLRYYLIFSVVTFNLQDSRIDISSTIQIEKSLFDFLVALPPSHSLSFFRSFFLMFLVSFFYFFLSIVLLYVTCEASTPTAFCIPFLRNGSGSNIKNILNLITLGWSNMSRIERICSIKLQFPFLF